MIILVMTNTSISARESHFSDVKNLLRLLNGSHNEGKSVWLVVLSHSKASAVRFEIGIEELELLVPVS